MFEEKNDLQDYFNNNPGRLIHKWQHYFPIYEAHFKRFRNRPVTILEIGCYHGGSLQMWKRYFGEQAVIHGVDYDPRCRILEEDRVHIHIGDQADKKFLRTLRDELPRIDILIDDGGHQMDQQLNTFDVLYPHVADDGVYLCEDLHTSYWKSHKGGYRRRGTFIEFSKNLIDSLNAFHSQDPRKFRPDDFSRSAHSMHFYDSVLVIEKRPRTDTSLSLKSGTPTPEFLNPPI